MPEINRLVPEAGIMIHLKSKIYRIFGAFLGPPFKQHRVKNQLTINLVGLESSPFSNINLIAKIKS